MAARSQSRKTLGREIPHRLVLVLWDDSSQPISQWQWVDDYSCPEIVECASVGFLIAETEQAIALAPNLGDIRQDRRQASGIFRIPRSAVRKIVEL
jgi:hypothetical protein